jgi:hypothetical protein
MEQHIEVNPKTPVGVWQGNFNKLRAPNIFNLGSQRNLPTMSSPTLTARETRAFLFRHLHVRARLLALRLVDPRYVAAGSGTATSRILGGNATPTALKT